MGNVYSLVFPFTACRKYAIEQPSALAGGCPAASAYLNYLYQMNTKQDNLIWTTATIYLTLRFIASVFRLINREFDSNQQSQGPLFARDKTRIAEGALSLALAVSHGLKALK